MRGEEERNASRCLVVIGASAGGPKAVLEVLKELPASTCGILVVQHLSRGFSGRFAEYLDSLCRMHVKEAQSGEVVSDGMVYVAADGCQMTVKRLETGYALRCAPGERVGGFCPSISCTMKSVAEAAGERAMGIVLTGMGEDGAEGLLSMRRAGAYTIAQDRATSEIYSMPEAAFIKGGARKQVALNRISGEIMNFCISRNNKTGR